MLRHGGDNQTGAGDGDDETIFLELARVHPSVKYIGFVINSYSGEELDDVANAGCHLFFPGGRDFVKFTMTNTAFLDKHTALLLGMLHRDPTGAVSCTTASCDHVM